MKTKKTQKDFFSGFRLHKFRNIRMYMLTCFMAIFGAFFLNVIAKSDVDTSRMMASISHISESKNEYFADLTLIKQNNGFDLIFGSHAQNIDTIEGILLSDEGLKGIHINSENIKLIKLSDDMYRFIISLNGETIKKGMKIAHFEIEGGESNKITLTDTQFVSQGIRYDISNIVE